MTSREGYDAYTLYLGIKLHFYSKDYNFVKYNGKVKADINSFIKRKDKYHFGKLYKKYKNNLQDFYIANLSVYDLWAGDLLENECDGRYRDWKKRQQKLTYMFETIQEKVVYPDVHNKINKYKAFLSYPQQEYKTKLIELCST